jgi:MoaA/NifB/PqqE/SkfB family radical SAM enzyme
MSLFNISQKINFAKSFVLKKNPLYVQFYITARCNLACQQCNIIYADAKHQEMSIEEINQVAENLKQIGVNIVLLIGGEHFVRKDIHEIVKAFTSRNIHVRMQTNGIANESQLKKCVENGGKDISISLDTLKPQLQDEINGGFNKSWARALNTISMVSNIFPEGSTAFFNSVIMPKNLKEIINVIKFATKIGWGVSLVPVHVSSPDKPMGYRTLDYDNNVTFNDEYVDDIKKLISTLKNIKKNYNLYDSEEYIEDIENFLLNKPVKWREKNNNVCDSPNLYFAISPSGTLKTCCDYEATEDVYVYSKDFPKLYQSGEIEKIVSPITKGCDGCMYGSYPEISITARYLMPLIQRLKYFNYSPPKIKKLSTNELEEIAAGILNEQN